MIPELNIESNNPNFLFAETKLLPDLYQKYKTKFVMFNVTLAFNGLVYRRILFYACSALICHSYFVKFYWDHFAIGRNRHFC